MYQLASHRIKLYIRDITIQKPGVSAVLFFGGAFK